MSTRAARSLAITVALALCCAQTSVIARADDGAAANTEAPPAKTAADEPSESAGKEPATANTEHAATTAPRAVEPVDTSTSAPEAVAALSHAKRKQELEAALGQVEREQRDASLLMPTSALVISTALVVTGIALAIGHTASCEGSCRTSPWPGWLILSGTTLGTASLAWLLLKERDHAELASRRYHLERELERLEWNVSALAPTKGPRLELRARF